MQTIRKTVLFCLLALPGSVVAQQVREVDICVYGGSSAGVIAAYTASKMNKSVVVIEPGKRLGGLTSGGLGYTDIGNKYAISGISRDYYRRIGKHYGKFETWIFEPSVAEKVFKQYVQEAALDIVYDHRITKVKKSGGKVTEIQLESSVGGTPKVSTVRAKMYIDCSYEGDLLALAGISYTVGREANAQYGETYNGVQLRDKHQFPEGIDPYKIPGDPTSGVLWGISTEPLAAQGVGDKKVQAYNFRICLSNQPENRVPITRPEGYDSTRYELLLRVVNRIKPGNLNGILKFDRMPNHKTDINNNGSFSTDMIGMNWNYPEADYATRANITKAHELYNKGLLYFIGHDPRMPENLRKEMLQWGYPKDEYVEFGNWSPQMYVREARRMVGAYVMTQANCEGRATVDDGVGMAAYTMDSHNCQRIIVDGMVKNEGDVQIGGFGPYPISYRSIIPKAEDCGNVLVTICLSASHIAYGSIRMEPVFMVLGQSAATAASMAIDAKQTVQQVDVAKLRETLRARPLATNATAEILVDNDDQQQVTVTGNWKKINRGAYGPSAYVSEKGAAGTVRFTPKVVRSGIYKVYSYVPKQADMSNHTSIKISTDGKSVKPLDFAADAVKVEGQTSGEWVDLGTVKLTKGGKGYVEITTDGADGVVVADAVLFIPVR
ncbi:FAD-dependent oxidoreductase [Chitinophaga rhizosphaerae]|uniref:FAD-dependent oxidoreductase n=1 Tax=Chitinophaga rhizosphaerae TaxID=1864947 RepID=UPI000F8062AD|nr:FAD-dependent oxidoreductase [Chitinophaga rhizosphaerae]